MAWTLNHKSKIYLVVFYAFAAFQILFCGGITYGWATIVPVFKAEGLFYDLCEESQLQVAHGSNNSMNGSDLYSNPRKDDGAKKFECAAQRERLNLVFNVAVFSVAASSLPIGAFLDKFGPKMTLSVGCIIYLLAGVGLAVLSKGIANILFPTFIFLSLGGVLCTIPLYQTVNIVFGRLKSLALCILNGAFDSSSIILVIFKIAYDSGISLRNISIFYASVSLLFMLILIIFLIPSYKNLLSFHDDTEHSLTKDPIRDDIGKRLANYSAKLTNGDKSADARMTLLVDDEMTENAVALEEEDQSHSEEEQLSTADKCPETFKESAFSLMCFLQFLFVTILQLRLWFFIGSLNSYLNLVLNGDKKLVGSYLEIFGYIQLGGILVATIIGLIFDRNLIGQRVDKKAASSRRHKLRSAVLAFALTNLLGLLLSILSITKSKGALIPLFVLVVFMRGFLYSGAVTLTGLAYKPQFFGRIYGLIMFSSALFGLLQFPCVVISEKYFDSNPYWINMAMLILVLLSSALPIYLWYYTRIQTKPKTLKVSLKEGAILKDNDDE